MGFTGLFLGYGMGARSMGAIALGIVLLALSGYIMFRHR